MLSKIKHVGLAQLGYDPGQGWTRSRSLTYISLDLRSNGDDLIQHKTKSSFCDPRPVLLSQVKQVESIRKLQNADEAAAARRSTALTRRTRPAKNAGERKLRRNLTTTHRVIKRARLSAYLAVMGTRHISTRLLLVSSQ